LNDPPGESESTRFEDAITAREARTPVSHITGEREFWGRSFHVTCAVLDPRPETETLIAHVLEGPPARRILDLGTGSGCILLTLLAEWPQATGLGIDISAAALEVAAGNARRLGVEERAQLAVGDWCAGLVETFDLIVSNPPYIAASEMPGLSPEVRLHEPLNALTPDPDPGGDGLEAYRRIAACAASHLGPEGRLLLEIGPTQGAAVQQILADAGLPDAAILPDLDRRDRVISARK
jgi:release factor glutamine methyltransferase